MYVRSIVSFIAVLLIGAQILRNMAVGLSAPARPAQAAAAWSSNPAAELSLGMARIAEAARDRRPVPDATLSTIKQASNKAPLAAEPYLVSGVQSELAGDGATAQRSFEAAQWRDPRSLPAAFFLAGRYLQFGDADRGLREAAAFARLAPGGRTTLGPYLAAFAQDPKNWPALRNLFARERGLGEATLVALASKPQTVPAVLALADRASWTGKPEWLAPLLNTLTDAGQYQRARDIWARASGARAGELIHDTAFIDRASPPPFNWALTTSAVGLAERQSGKKLHILFYGQEDGTLVTQLLLLQQGTYRLSARLVGGDGDRAKALSWSIWCDKASTPLSGMTVDAAAAQGWIFQVPAGCPAQWLRVSGTSMDISQQVDVTLGDLTLQKVRTGG